MGIAKYKSMADFSSTESGFVAIEGDPCYRCCMHVEKFKYHQTAAEIGDHP